MSDEKKPRRKKSAQKFRFIDAVILILILAIVAVALIAYLPGLLSGFSGSKKTVEYTVVFLAPVEEETYNAIFADQYVLTDKADFGRVKNVSSLLEEDQRWSGVVYEEDKRTVKLVISAEAQVAKTGVTVGGKTLAIGQVIPLILPAYTGDAVVTNITVGG